MSNEREYYENPALWTPSRYEGPNMERTKEILKLLPSDVESVLDTGCGNGILVNQLLDNNSVVGIDRSMAALKWVKTKRCQADVAQLPFDKGAFDAVISNEVLEHLPVSTFSQTLSEMLRVARRYILITVPYQEQRECNRAKCPECGCQFHAHYHMRSFYLDDLQNLFDNRMAISLVKVAGIVRLTNFWLHKEWIMMRDKLSHRELNFRQFSKCPQCGYSTSKKTDKKEISDKQQITYGRYLKSIIKPIWPKYEVPRWWLALYVKR